MGKVDKRVIKILKSVEADIRAWNPDDRAAPLRISAALEKIIPEVSQKMGELDELLQLVLAGLQILHDSRVPDGRGLIQALTQAILTTTDCLLQVEGPALTPRIKEANHALWEAMSQNLGGPARHANQPATASPERPRLSLDEVAALLVQLEPTNRSELMQVQEALTGIANQESAAPSVRQLAAEAAEKIGEIIQGKCVDPARNLADVGHGIEAMAEAMEAQGPEPAHVPADEKDTMTHQESDKRPVEDLPSPAASFESQANSRLDGQDAGPRPSPSSHTPSGGPAKESIVYDQLPADADLDLLGDFITESREYLEGAEAALLSLETNPEDTEAINTVFRAFHTIKGTSAFLGLTRTSELAHHAESLLSRMRDQEIRCTGGYADLALRSADMLKELLQAVQNTLIGEPMLIPDGYDDLIAILSNPEAAGITGESDEAGYERPRLGDILVAESKVSRKDVEAAAAEQGPDPIGLALLKSETASLTDVAKALRTQQRMAGNEPAMESSVRVRTDRLDRLIDMVGELVIAQSMVAQDKTVLHGSHHELLRKITHAGKIVRELQDLSMSMRMIPLKATFQKMARLVRDLAQKSGKKIHLVADDNDTEIDRNMVEVINDLLVHMVRNSVDHGIEPPDVRQKNGKSRTATIHLSAYHSGGSVVVEIQDDGKGLDRDKIIEKALSKGLIESAKGMSDRDVFNLIFAPGFSTADQVTDISGRGVGMDVVRKGVEAFRGRIDISSEAGKGCTFSVRLPLTLAITDGMLVKVGEERYIVPTINIHLSFRPDPSALSTIAGHGEMVMLREELMPMFRLHRLFNIQKAAENPTNGLLVVVGDGDQRYALLVDELLGQQQVVAKSLGHGMGKIQGISGGAILGDGRVGLILDPSGIAAMARQAPTNGDGKGTPCRSAA